MLSVVCFQPLSRKGCICMLSGNSAFAYREERLLLALAFCMLPDKAAFACCQTKAALLWHAPRHWLLVCQARLHLHAVTSSTDREAASACGRARPSPALRLRINSARRQERSPLLLGPKSASLARVRQGQGQGRQGRVNML